MKNLRNPVVALVIFGMLVALCITIYDGFEEGYDLEETGTHSVEIDGVNSSGTIMEQLERLNLVKGMNEIGESIQEIGTPATGFTDILGALAGVAIGALKTITGIVTIIPNIGIIIASYYQIPTIVYVGISTIFFVIIGFILVSAYLGREV